MHVVYQTWIVSDAISRIFRIHVIKLVRKCVARLLQSLDANAPVLIFVCIDIAGACDINVAAARAEVFVDHGRGVAVGPGLFPDPVHGVRRRVVRAEKHFTSDAVTIIRRRRGESEVHGRACVRPSYATVSNPVLSFAIVTMPQHEDISDVTTI